MRDRRRVVGLDVQQDVLDALRARCCEPGEGHDPAQADALDGGVDPDDVHLAQPVGVLLGPVEAEQPAVRARRRAGPRGRTTARPSARPGSRRPSRPARGGRRRPRVDAEELARRRSRGSRARPRPSGTAYSGEGLGQRPPHHPQLAHPLEPVSRRPAARRRGGRRATTPRAPAGPWPSSAFSSSAPPSPWPRASGCTTRLSGPVGDQREPVSSVHAVRVVALGVAQREPGRLVERCRPVGLLGRGGDPVQEHGAV